MDGSGGQDAFALAAGMAGAPELAQALINAAQPAAQAAQAAQAASSSSGGSGILKKDLAKLIPRPSSFSPADREHTGV